jgi:hypothetical protein
MFLDNIELGDAITGRIKETLYRVHNNTIKHHLAFLVQAENKKFLNIEILEHGGRRDTGIVQ